MRLRIPGTILWRNARRLKGDRRGSAAVEFALVAPIFFGLLFAIIESALVFFAGQLLETATQDSARLVLTGQAQDGAYTQQQFKDQVCARLSSIFNCSSGVYVDVQSYARFSDASVSAPIDGSGQLITATHYDFGERNSGPGSRSYVVVRIWYEWPLFVTGLGFNIANLANKNRVIMGTAVFRNEPP